MAEVFVSHLAGALGSQLRSVEAAAKAGVLFSDSAALREAGFRQHRFCTDYENPYSLALEAMQASGIDAAAVDCIVYSTCLPLNGNVCAPSQFEQSHDVKHLMDFPASRLQADLGMERAFVIGLNQQACTGMLGSIRIARNMLLAEQDLQQILCVTSDRFPQGSCYEQSYNLISDGAAVCLVGRRVQGFRVLACGHHTNGALVQASDDENVGSFFSNVHRVVTDTLERAQLSMDQVRWVIPQNTNRKAWTILASLLGVSQRQTWFESMPDVAHVISADNIINLKQLEASGQLSAGDRVLTFMAGYGANWQCLLLERV